MNLDVYPSDHVSWVEAELVAGDKGAIYSMYEVMEYTDVRPSIDNPNPAPLERSIGVFEVEHDAVEAGRAVRAEFIESDRPDYTWWTVRQPGSRLANWIADSHSPKEFMLDLTTGELVEME